MPDETRERAPGAVPRVYCTAFDSNYLCRGLALWQSLRAVAAEAQLWVCCLDQSTEDVLTRLALPGVSVFGVAQVEDRYSALLRVKATRSRIEYYFTLTPSVVRFALEEARDAVQVTYLDADLYFFADPEPLFQELAAAKGSVGIIAHRFPERLKDREKYGIYNVGWLTFARDDRGLACLDDWQRRCIDWCYARVEDGRFADQKYLDDWPARFAGVVPLQHKGANVALWNLDGAEVTASGGKPVINGVPLLFYHFHAITRRLPWLFRTSAGDYGERLGVGTRRLIYAPYLRAWRNVENVARRELQAMGSAENELPPSAIARLRNGIAGFGSYARHIRDGEYLIAARPGSIRGVFSAASRGANGGMRAVGIAKL